MVRGRGADISRRGRSRRRRQAKQLMVARQVGDEAGAAKAGARRGRRQRRIEAVPALSTLPQARTRAQSASAPGAPNPMSACGLPTRLSYVYESRAHSLL